MNIKAHLIYSIFLGFLLLIYQNCGSSFTTGKGKNLSSEIEFITLSIEDKSDRISEACDKYALDQVGSTYRDLATPEFLLAYGEHPSNAFTPNELGVTQSDWRVSWGRELCSLVGSSASPLQEDGEVSGPTDLTEAQREQLEYFSMDDYTSIVVRQSQNTSGEILREYRIVGNYNGIGRSASLEGLNIGLYISKWQCDILRAGMDLPGEKHSFANAPSCTPDSESSEGSGEEDSDNSSIDSVDPTPSPTPTNQVKCYELGPTVIEEMVGEKTYTNKRYMKCSSGCSSSRVAHPCASGEEVEDEETITCNLYLAADEPSCD